MTECAVASGYPIWFNYSVSALSSWLTSERALESIDFHTLFSVQVIIRNRCIVKQWTKLVFLLHLGFGREK